MFLLTRHEGGPILSPSLPWEKVGVFNPGVVKTKEGVIMLYRAMGETEAGISHIGLAKSSDGVHFERVKTEPVFGPKEDFDKWATEDPRITEIEGEFYVTYVAISERIMLNGESFPRTTPLETATALLKTKDFISFENLGIISPEHSDNKDIVLFPRKINGRYAMLHRPNFWHRTLCDHLKNDGSVLNWSCDITDLPQFPAIWYSTSDDLKNWSDHKVALYTTHQGDAKLGPGLPPIETPEGWLVIYQHVSTPPGGSAYTYTVRAALFDLNDPTKLVSKLHYDILAPEMPYEKERAAGIVFPTGGYVEGDTLYVYYGASDKYVCLSTGALSLLLQELKNSGKETK